MQTHVPSLSQTLTSLAPNTPIQIRSGTATAGGRELPEQDGIRLAALAAHMPRLTVAHVTDLLMTGVYQRLVVHTRRMGPVEQHTLGLRAKDRSSIPLAQLWDEVRAVHAERMKAHATKEPVRILEIQGRTVAQLADGKRFPVANLVRNRVAVGGTYPAYILTFSANGRPMHVAVPMVDQEVHVELGARVNLPRSLAAQVKGRAEELHFQNQMDQLTSGGKIELGNFAL